MIRVTTDTYEELLAAEKALDKLSAEIEWSVIRTLPTDEGGLIGVIRKNPS